MEAYLARLALILCLSRAVESGAREQIEPQDIRTAARLVEYFKAHARRMYITLHGESQQGLLAAELKGFLEEHGGEWEGEPNVLREALVERKSEVVPGQAAELSKTVLDIASYTASVKVERAWGKKEGKSHRILRLALKKPVDRVVPVDLKADSDNTDNGVYGALDEASEEHPDWDNRDNTVYRASEDLIQGGMPDNNVGLENDPGMDF